MDFSAWDWATHFRLHEAACLIAGVMPVSKKMPTSEDLPPQARPILLKLMGAYYEWYLQAKNPERPKTITLRGTLNEDGTLPEFPVPTVLVGEIVSRAAIRNFISDMGRKSAYDFSPIEQKKLFTPAEAGAGEVVARLVQLKQANTLPQAGAVEAAEAQPDSITSRQVATFFDGLPYTAENWPKRLSDTKWLLPAKIALGEVGGITGLWCPLILARLIHGREKGREKQKTLEALNSRFKRNTALQPWRDAWNEHYALFTDAIDD